MIAISERAFISMYPSIAKSDSSLPHGWSQDCERLRSPMQSVEGATDRYINQSLPPAMRRSNEESM